MQEPGNPVNYEKFPIQDIKNIMGKTKGSDEVVFVLTQILKELGKKVKEEYEGNREFENYVNHLINLVKR